MHSNPHSILYNKMETEITTAGKNTMSKTYWNSTHAWNIGLWGYREKNIGRRRQCHSINISGMKKIKL